MPAKSLFSTSYDCSSEASSSWGSVRGSCCTSSCWLTVRIPSRMSRITSVSVLAIVPGRRKWNRTRMRPCSHTSVRRIADGSSIDSPISDLSSFSYSCRGSPDKATSLSRWGRGARVPRSSSRGNCDARFYYPCRGAIILLLSLFEPGRQEAGSFANRSEAEFCSPGSIRPRRIP